MSADPPRSPLDPSRFSSDPSHNHPRARRPLPASPPGPSAGPRDRPVAPRSVKIAPGAVVCVESEIRGDVTIGKGPVPPHPACSPRTVRAPGDAGLSPQGPGP